MALKTVLKYESELYYTEALRTGSMTAAQMKAEYQRLRKIANKRISALGRSEFVQSESYQQHKEGFAPYSKLDKRSLEYELSSLARFVTAKTSSVTGQREIRDSAIRSLREQGYTFINKKNFRDFTEFMEYARTTKLARGRKYSNAVLELFGVLQKKKIDPETVQEKFSEWVRENGYEKMQEIISASINKASAKKIKKMIG